MHNNKREVKIISNLRSWIGFEPVQGDHARIMGHWLAGVAHQQCHQTVIAQYVLIASNFCATTPSPNPRLKA
jgi:hypothetical protein